MPETVQLFVTCLLDTLYPDTAWSVVRVLNRAGARVHVPEGQTCCGQPAFNAGMRREARPMAEQIIRVFERTKGPVVVPSGSCAAMIKFGYPELFEGDREWSGRARALAERIYEFSQYLVDVLGVTDLGASYNGRVSYHSSCHLLREMGVDRQPQVLMQNVQEAELIELPEAQECCGFGGVFSVEYPEISAAMLERKIDNIRSTGAGLVVSCDAGCITNINGGLQRQGLKPCMVHLADLLDWKE